MIVRAIYKFGKLMVVVNMGQHIAPFFLDHTSPFIESGYLLNDTTSKR